MRPYPVQVRKRIAVKGASGADLVVHQYASADLTISSTLADNGAATSLTKSGPGKLIITGTDNMTGTNFLNGGTVEVSDLAKLAEKPHKPHIVDIADKFRLLRPHKGHTSHTKYNRQ